MVSLCHCFCLCLRLVVGLGVRLGIFHLWQGFRLRLG
jgi:hypothetical protein